MSPRAVHPRGARLWEQLLPLPRGRKGLAFGRSLRRSRGLPLQRCPRALLQLGAQLTLMALDTSGDHSCLLCPLQGRWLSVPLHRGAGTGPQQRSERPQPPFQASPAERVVGLRRGQLESKLWSPQ